jgi:hypothetical protein
MVISACVKNGSGTSNIPYVDPHCPPFKADGISFHGDLVGSPNTAKVIGDAVIAEWSKRHQPGVWSQAVIRDGGQFWIITEIHKKLVYSGGIAFEIDKCNGTISHMEISTD